MLDGNLLIHRPVHHAVITGVAPCQPLRHYIYALLLSLITWLGVADVIAATDPAFVEVAINGQSAEEETAAYEVGLRIVLLRLAPANKPLSAASIRRAEAEAASFVQQRDFRVPSASDKITRQTPLTQRVRDTGQATHLISIRFSRDSINQLILSEADLTEAGEEDEEPVEARSALVWLLIEDGNQSVVVGGSSARNVMDRVREIGGGVGQQLQFPERDELEQQRLTSEDLRSADIPKILSSSQRYLEPVVLVGTLTRARGRTWNAQWRRIQGESQTTTSFEANSLDQALQSGIRWLAGADSELADGSNPTASQSSMRQQDNEGLIWIGSVIDVRAYSRVVSLIDDMEGATVYLKLMSGDALIVAVSPRAAVNDVARLLLNSSRLVNAGSAPALAGGLRPDVALQYAR